MNLNYYDLNKKGFDIICSVLDQYCVKYKIKVNSREVFFGRNSSYEIHTQELKPDAYILMNNKINEKLEFLSKLDEQYNLPTVEPEWEKNSDKESNNSVECLTLADLIERNSFIHKMFDDCPKNNLVNFTFDPYESEESSSNIFKEKFQKLKDLIQKTFKKEIKIDKKRDKTFEEKEELTFNELPTDVKEILIHQFPLQILKESKYEVTRFDSGVTISIKGK